MSAGQHYAQPQEDLLELLVIVLRNLSHDNEEHDYHECEPVEDISDEQTKADNERERLDGNAEYARRPRSSFENRRGLHIRISGHWQQWLRWQKELHQGAGERPHGGSGPGT